VAAGDAALQLVRGALGDQPAVVEERDPVGQLVRFLEVLGGQEDRDPAGHEVADELPHGAAAAGSRPVVGSSRKMIRGSPTRPMARSSFRRMPPE
jgi:hypothetical protein